MYKEILGYLESFDNIVWGPPTIILIMGVGLILSFRIRLLQFRRLPKALKYMWHNEEGGEGEVSSFQALCTALAATVGTGNIVGVATAIMGGGPGALFWMLVAACLGMATKYAEGLLAVKYREYDKEDGHALGGPFYYIENGMGEKWKWLGKLFALFGVLAGIMGIGTITQASSITNAAKRLFDPTNKNIAFSIGNAEYSWSTVIATVVLTLCVGLVLIGGIKRIAVVAEKIVPTMIVIYVVACLGILIYNGDKLGAAFMLVIKSAFGNGYTPIVGGTMGAVLRAAIQYGVARGIFSNEAGLGSAPIAAAAARTKEPVRQGLVSMTGTFIDTIIICTMTGLSIVVTGAYLQKEPATGKALEGVDVTIFAFGEGLPWSHSVGALVLLLSLSMFAFTTILGWNYYAERCLEYLVGRESKINLVYRWMWVLVVFVGPFLTLKMIWTIADIFNGFMAVPNLIGLFALSGVVAAESKSYFKRLNAGEIVEFADKEK